MVQAFVVKAIHPAVIAFMGMFMLSFPFLNTATDQAVKIIGHEVGVYYGRMASTDFTVYFSEQPANKEQPKEQVEDVKISIRTKSKNGEGLDIHYNRKGKTPLNDEESELIKKITEAIVVYNTKNKASISERANFLWQEIKRGLSKESTASLFSKKR